MPQVSMRAMQPLVPSDVGAANSLPPVSCPCGARPMEAGLKLGIKSHLVRVPLRTEKNGP